MFKRLRIKNFKSFRDIELNLGKVNVIVGPNGSGKSNLVDFFIFLRELVTPTGSVILNPFLTLGGYKEVVFLHDINLPIEFEIEGENFYYSASVTSENWFLVNRETLRYNDFLVNRSTYNVEIKNEKRNITIKTTLQSYEGLFSLSQRNPPLSELRELFEFMKNFYKSFVPLRINPERVFLPIYYSTVSKIDVDGYGISKLMEIEGIPEQVKDFAKENNLDLSNLKDLSTGEKKMIALLFVIFGLKPSLVVIDEVENSLHLNFIEELASAIKYSEPQFVIITHSPMVIDMFGPEDIILFYKEKGETKAKRIENPKELEDELFEKGLALSEWIFYSSSI